MVPFVIYLQKGQDSQNHLSSLLQSEGKSLVDVFYISFVSVQILLIVTVFVLVFIEKAASSPCTGKERFDLDSIHIDNGLKDEVWLYQKPCLY